MKKWIEILGAYLKGHILNIIIFIICFLIFLVIFLLYSLPLEALKYAFLLIGFFLFLVGSMDYIKFYKKHKILKTIQKNRAISQEAFPSPQNLIEKDYQEWIKGLEEHRKKMIDEKDRRFMNMIDYYTLWSHQIKTPISAMRLLLQSEQSNLREELLEQLFKVEQYVEKVLQYLRIENMENDLVFKRHSLDDIVKQAVRKYAKIFIRRKIKLHYQRLDYEVLTDEKWLLFVIEQILSNSLKYTKQGDIFIYMDKNLSDTLVIEDTGKGIEQEDLPRIFERGFTGYNGRFDKTSTGMGLFLSKQILNRLSHTIAIESIAGKGTKVKIGLDTTDILLE